MYISRAGTVNIGKCLLLVAIFLVFNTPTHASEESKQWTVSTKPFYKSPSAKKDLLGQSWSLASQNKTLRLKFTLNISSDFQNGAWHGQINSQVQFQKMLLLVHTATGKNERLEYFKLRNQGGFPVKQKNGDVKQVYAVTFDIEWDELLKIKEAKSIIIKYSSVNEPDKLQISSIALTSYPQAINNTILSVKKNKSAGFYVLSERELDAIVIKDLPKRLQNKQLYLAKIKLSHVKTKLNLAQVMDLSLAEIKKVAREENDRMMTSRKRAHQKIYDQEPKWLDMNMCPNPSVKYCRYVGRHGLEEYADFLRLDPFDHGKIVGVVWRSKNSIVKIHGGSIERDISPEIVRTDKAGYYYLFLNKKGTRVNEVRRVETVTVK